MEVSKRIRTQRSPVQNQIEVPSGERWFATQVISFDRTSVVVSQKRLIQEIKMVLRVLVLYIPLPMFWALYDQQVREERRTSELWEPSLHRNVGLIQDQTKGCWTKQHENTFHLFSFILLLKHEESFLQTFISVDFIYGIILGS